MARKKKFLGLKPQQLLVGGAIAAVAIFIIVPQIKKKMDVKRTEDTVGNIIDHSTDLSKWMR
jgi:MFS superfamily sulfate permease-like transporter